jgi:hypothetical protein
MRIIIAFIAFVFILASCKKAEDRPCFKGVGDETIVERELASFQTLFLGPHLNYVLVQDTVEKVVLTGGENLVNFIGTNITEGELRITNDNRCNFLRTYKKSVTVEIHLINVNSIEFQGTKPLTCQNALTCPFLHIKIIQGAGAFNLKVNNSSLKTNISNGWGNMVVSGSTNYANLNAGSNGVIDSYGLAVQDSLHVISKTPSTLKVNATATKFKSETSATGDIWYIGTPTVLEHLQIGTGELIDKN